MADEKLTLEFDVQGLDRVTSLYRSASAAVTGAGAGASGGMMSIANVITQAQALSGASAGAMVAVGGVVAALAALRAALRTASEAVVNFGNLQNQLGSSVQSAGFLQTVGRSLGLGDMGALAAQLRVNATQGMGAAAGAALGLGFSPFDVGPALDTSEALMKLLTQIREFHIAGKDAEMRTYLRNLGMGHLEMAKYIDEETMALIRREQQSRNALFNEETNTRAMRLNVEMARLSMAWQDLITELGTRAIPLIIWGTNMLRSLVPGASGGAGTRNDAIRENTQAIRELRQTVQDTNGIYGGGARMQNAIPRAFRGANIAFGDAMMQSAMRFGAYAVTL